LTEAMRRNPIADLFNENTEHERRDAALSFCVAVSELSEDAPRLSPSQAVFFLYLCGWDIGAAVSRWLATPTHDNHRDLGQFDRLRETLPREVRVADVKTILGQDERLAVFINITGRQDWYSLRERLVEADWNLVEAVMSWFLHGVHPERPPRRVGETGIRTDSDLQQMEWPNDSDCEALPDTVLDPHWAQEPDLFMPDTLDDEDSDTNSVDSVEDDENGSIRATSDGKKPKGTTKVAPRARRDGFLIHIDSTLARNTAQAGVPDENLFLLE
jgi:hypothetical protein